jgi:ABC-2 type transport system permease protein
MNRIWASIKKEFLILVRDWAGLALIFLMPALLVLVMTLIQDTTFRKINETSLSVLLLDEDQDTLGRQIVKGFEETRFVEVVTHLEGQTLSEELLYDEVAKGSYQMGLVIRKGATEAIRDRGQVLVRQTLGLAEEVSGDSLEQATIVLYFDPAIKNSFKLTLRNALQNYTSQIEGAILFQALTDEMAQYLPMPPEPLKNPGGGIRYEEIYATDRYSDIIPNSVQHNVPAWTIFAMFFIIIPLTGNIIKERESGLATRLRMMPGNRFQALAAKVSVYMMVGLLQCLIMLQFGKQILPMFGVPALVFGPEKLALALMALATILAATGYSVLVGSIARTHDQAAVFGVVSVILLAAIGGIWVPVFMMPELMQHASIVSPLNWSLNGFYDILLRGGGIPEIAGNLASLAGFFVVTLVAAVVVSENKTVGR